MGVMCKIHLQRPADGVYRPGSAIQGAVQYAVDKDTVYQDIAVNFKGKGKCRWTEGSNKSRRTYVGTQNFFHFQTSILANKRGDQALVVAGAYSAPFTFFIPKNIPPSYKDYVCRVDHYVSIKFTQPGMFNSSKKFKTSLLVCNLIIPTMPAVQIDYSMEKKLTEVFGKSNSVVKLRASLSKSLLVPLEKADVVFNIENNTNVKNARVTTNLMEIVTYTANSGRQKKRYRKFKECKSTIEGIEEQSSFNCGTVVTMPKDVSTIQHSNILSRNYEIIVTIKLPFPHRNSSLKMPLDIGYDGNLYYVLPMMEAEHMNVNEIPPDYWVAMEEDKSSYFKNS